MLDAYAYNSVRFEYDHHTSSLCPKDLLLQELLLSATVCFLWVSAFSELFTPSNKDGAHHAWAILSLLVKGLRKAWPDAQIIFRGDSGFCRHKMLEWCDRRGVFYIVGIPRNHRL